MVAKYFFVVCVAVALVLPGRWAWAQGEGLKKTSATDAGIDLRTRQNQLVEQGVDFYNDEEFEKAKAILLPLAEAGHPKAMNMIGLMHDGTNVFPNDPSIECDWYEKSAKSGYVSAMYNLSICYDGNGRMADPAMSKELLIRATNLGHIRSMINLSSLDKSEGEEYRFWMNKAREHGSVYAKVDLYLQGYAHDVPDLYIQDKVCVYVRILLLDGDLLSCD